MAKKQKHSETPETLEIRAIETFSTYISRESITITISDYPELEGKSEEEIKDYINENDWEMKAPSDCEWADSLADALSQMDTIKEKITDDYTEYSFE